MENQTNAISKKRRFFGEHVTEQVEALDTLDAIERDAALRNAVVDVALDCIVMMDQNGMILAFNPAAEQTFGYKREEVVGRNLADVLIPEELRDAHHMGLQKYLETGEGPVLGKRIEVEAINSQNERLWVELAISPVEYADITYFSAYLRDITAAKLADQKLKLSEQKFQSLFDLSADAIVVHDFEGVILDVNQTATTLLQRSKEELIGTRVADLHPKEQGERSLAALQEMWDTGSARLQLDLVRADGVLVPTEIVARLMDTEAGVVCHGVVRDITDRVAYEKSLKAAKEAAERANDAKSEFLANMSHEMRTPLNGVLGSLGLVERDHLLPSQRELIESAEHSGETLLTLIQDLLDLSKIEAGVLEISKEPFDPADALDIVRQLFEPVAREKGLGLSIDNPDQDVTLLADGGRIRQVIINLVGNAIKFTDSGQVSVRAKVSTVEEQPRFRVEVQDTGPGISDANQAVLFDRFRQLDSSHSKRHGGAGLGLAICRELITLMSGEMGVSSQEGQGSTFWFDIPSQIDKRKTRRTTALQEVKAKLSGHILLAEDSATNAAVACRLLKKLGVSCDCAKNGKEAFVRAQSGDYDLVLMDIGMPEMDGLQATRMLRENGFNKPIIALTAHALQGDREKALEAGMNGYLTKPMRFDEFKEELVKWMSLMDDEQVGDEIGGLDVPAIEELWGDDMETYDAIAEIFLGELTDRLTRLSCLQAQALEHEAHSLKGASANVGASHLSSLAAELEETCRNRMSDNVSGLIHKIEVEAGRVTAQIQQRI